MAAVSRFPEFLPIRLGQGRSGVELIDGVTMPRNGSSTGHGRKEQEPTVKKEIQKAIRHYGKTVQENITCELLRAGMQEAFPSGGVRMRLSLSPHPQLSVIAREAIAG